MKLKKRLRDINYKLRLKDQKLTTSLTSPRNSSSEDTVYESEEVKESGLHSNSRDLQSVFADDLVERQDYFY